MLAWNTLHLKKILNAVWCGLVWFGFQFEVSKSRRFCRFYFVNANHIISHKYSSQRRCSFSKYFYCTKSVWGSCNYQCATPKGYQSFECDFLRVYNSKEIYCIENGALQMTNGKLQMDLHEIPCFRCVIFPWSLPSYTQLLIHMHRVLSKLLL